MCVLCQLGRATSPVVCEATSPAGVAEPVVGSAIALPAASFTASSNQDINGLLSGLAWSSHDLTFSFPTSASQYGASYGFDEPLNSFDVVTAAQASAIRGILGAYSAVSNISFVEVTESGSQHGDLRFAQSNTPSTAWAYLPGSQPEGGDVWFNNASGWYDNPVRGNYAWMTVLHEVGHSLGLKHAHEADGYGATTAAHNSIEYTVMSYLSYAGSPTAGYTNESWGYAQSLMMYDIAALQHLYGANYDTNGGETTYRWDPSTGEEFINGVGQGAPGANRIFMTIWDGGGNDTYDFSSYTSNLTVDLAPGHWVTTSTEQLARLGAGHLAAGNIANALAYNNDPRSLIENAIGGAGNDTIIGNTADNVLVGGSGNDRLEGGETTGQSMLGIWGNGEIAADFNGDGRADILQFYQDGPYVALAQGNAPATFASWGNLAQTSPAQIATEAGTPLAADLNGDGRADLVEIRGSDTHVALATDTGFAAWSTWAGGATSDDLLADVNGDGSDDLLQFYSGRELVALSNGSSFGPWTDWGASVTANDRVADVNGDGRADLLQFYEGRVLVAQSTGSSFGPWTDWGNGASVSDRVIDLNGDDRADLLQFYDGRELVALSNGSSFDAWIVWGSGATVRDQIVDLDGDGNTDLLQIYNGRAVAALSDGSSFGAWTDWATGATATDRAMDVNGDGRADLLQVYNGHGYVALSSGAQFGAWTPWGLPGPTGNDTLTGGSGSDTFIFRNTFGWDTITDFTPAQDVIELASSQFGNFAAVQSHAAQIGPDVVITLDAQNAFTLQNVNLTNLHAVDFHFV